MPLEVHRDVVSASRAERVVVRLTPARIGASDQRHAPAREGAGRNTRGRVCSPDHVRASRSIHDLHPQSSATTSTAKPYPYTRTVTVSLISQKFELKAKKVVLIIAPSNTLYKPDTTTFVRSSANTMRTFDTDDPPL